jgi:hypothetical protein
MNEGYSRLQLKAENCLMKMKRSSEQSSLG